MSKPIVSIIIPVYNGENYLREAIDSALNQTYSNIEILVINDGSKDNGATEKIALSYGNKISYYAKENGGVATALNYGLQKMKGEYFSWLSHDDMYDSLKIEEQINALYIHGDLTSIVYSNYSYLDTKSNTIHQALLSNIYPIDKLTNSVFPVLQGLVHGCTYLIHKSHFERVGLFNEELITTQDYDLWFRMLRHQNTIYIPKPLIIARHHDEQGSKTLECHFEERCKLYIGFLEKLTDEEITSMYGSKYNFYIRMSSYFKGANMKEAYNYILKKLQDIDSPQDISKQLRRLEEYLKNLSNGKANKICIFCAGIYGISLYNELYSKLIFVDFFADNNEKKWGYLFNNIYCISPKELEEYKNNTLIIVATRTPDEIVNQLRTLNFPYITTKQEIDKLLLDVPPIKWLNSLEGVNEIDYSSKDVMLLVEKFNQTIFDICKYYESRIKEE